MIGVAREGDVELVLRAPISPCMAYGDDGSIRILPSQSSVMNRNVWIDGRLTMVEIEAVAIGDRRPVVNAGAAHGIHAEP